MKKGHTESWERNICRLKGSPVGVSLNDGRGTSGILCDADGRDLWIMEYLYHDQFAMKHYNYGMVQDIHAFPSCKHHSRRELTAY